MLKLVLCL
jgi:hypothetical protein